MSKKKPTAHEALIYLMVVTSAADRDMTDVELARIGDVVRTWPIFEDFEDRKLVKVAQDCQQLLHEDGGLGKVIALAQAAIPLHLHETALRRRLRGRGGGHGDAHGGASRAATAAAGACRRSADRRGHRAREQGAPSQPDVNGSRILVRPCLPSKS